MDDIFYHIDPVLKGTIDWNVTAKNFNVLRVKRYALYLWSKCCIDDYTLNQVLIRMNDTEVERWREKMEINYAHSMCEAASRYKRPNYILPEQEWIWGVISVLFEDIIYKIRDRFNVTIDHLSVGTNYESAMFEFDPGKYVHSNDRWFFVDMDSDDYKNPKVMVHGTKEWYTIHTAQEAIDILTPSIKKIMRPDKKSV